VVTVDMPHLRPEARELAALPAAERLAHLRSDRWIGHGRARLALGDSTGCSGKSPAGCGRRIC
jgi:hypothetical protein